MDVEGVSISFGARRVLRSVSFSLPAGRSLAIMGASGSGKSTLLSIISGTVKADSGHVRGIDHDRIEWVLQSAPVLARRTALENVMLGPLLQGCDYSGARLRALRVMRDLSIIHLARSRLLRLSGGERQRVALGRALSAESDLILADEPTAALDYEAKAKVLDSLQRAMRLQRRIVVATHDPDVAGACDDVFHLRDGKLVRA